MKHLRKQLSPPQIGSLLNIKVGIFSMLEAYERYVEGRKPYLVGKDSPVAELVEKMNEMSKEKFIEWLKYDMLKITEWLQELEKDEEDNERAEETP